MDKHFEKSIELLKAGNYKEALTILDRLIAEHPNNADYYSERGVVKFHLERIDDALKDMDKAVELQPTKSYRYSSRAYILGHAGMTKKAVENYQKAIELDPEDAVAHNNLGLLEEKMDYEEQAKRRFALADALVKDQSVDGRSDQEILGQALRGRNIQKELDEERANQSIWKVLKTLGSSEGRRSFGKFLRSGFKHT